MSGEEVDWIAGAGRKASRAIKAWADTEEAIGVLDVRLKREAGGARLDALYGFRSDVEARQAVLQLLRAYVEPGRPEVEHA